MASVVSVRADWLTRSRAWISLLLLAPVAVLAVSSVPHLPIDSWSEFALECVGCLLFFTGGFLRWWATLYIGGRKHFELICHGPYSICRNPLYLGTLLIAFSITVLIQSLSFALVLALVSYFYVTITVPTEEAYLRERHGAAFDAYCRRVPRFWPQWRLYESPEVIEVRVLGLRAELFRAVRWIWVPIACHLLTHLRCMDGWPSWGTLP